jgi:DNA-binding HxlR family transcriptional regulator
MKNHFGCPVQATANVMAGKWKVLIVWHLSFASRRFAELRRLLPGVSEKVLTAQLKELERDGVVRRLAEQTVPPRVDYLLSDAGKELISVMEAMCAWGTKHLGVPPSLPRLAPAAVSIPDSAGSTA